MNDTVWRVGFAAFTRIIAVGAVSALALTAAQAQETKSARGPADLGELLLTLFSKGTQLGNGDKSDSGATVIGREGLTARAGGSGDANAALLALPTVQYRSDTSGGDVADDIGENGDTELNLQPVEFSISGASVIENLILLDGVSINSSTGTVDPNSPNSSLDRADYMKLYRQWDLHSQTQYIPLSMVDGVEVIDSNVSAEFGGFQGGVVRYELKKPQRKHSGSVSFSYQDDSFVSYKLQTASGTNPDNVAKPEWRRMQFAAHLTGPMGERGSYIFGYSTRTAWTKKDRNPQYGDQQVESDSRSNFYRIGYGHEFANGGRLTVVANITDYKREWDSHVALYGLNVENSGLLLTSKYEKDLSSVNVLGSTASNLKFTLSTSFDQSQSGNVYDNGNEYFVWYSRYYRARSGVVTEDYHTDNFDSWCDSDLVSDSATNSVICYRGGLGETAYDDKKYKLNAKLTGDIWGGSFVLGGQLNYANLNRSASGFTFYSAGERISTPGVTFSCAAGDPSCTDTQAHWIRILQNPYDNEINAMQANLYLNFQKEWDRFELRAGVRADYNDVLKNVDVAPRLTGVFKATDRLSITFGANRYYSNNYLAYALHDGLPRGVNQRRDVDTTTGTVGDWYDRIDLDPYYYTQGDLKTPYNDEVTLALAYRDKWTEGNWRLRATHRMGKDQFARSESSSSLVASLTNNGRSEWTGLVLEYQNQWEATSMGALDRVGLNITGAWSKRQMSNDIYFGSAGESGIENFIYYNNTSYTENDFAVVTGNMDIPVKFSAEVTTTWHDGKYRLGLGADLTLGYTAAVDSGSNGDYVHSVYGSQRHDIYEDHKFKAIVTLNLAASAQIAQVRGKPLVLDLRVTNLLDRRRNGTADNENPWVSGRRVWLGTSLKW